MTEAELKAIEQRALLSSPLRWHQAEFIAHARTDIPALLAHIRAVEAENQRMRERINEAIQLIHADEPEGDYHRGMTILCELAGLRFPANEALKTARPMTIYEALRKAKE